MTSLLEILVRVEAAIALRLIKKISCSERMAFFYLKNADVRFRLYEKKKIEDSCEDCDN